MSERITGHTELIGLIAYPIRHSSSPKMHNEAFAKLGLDYAYLAFEDKDVEIVNIGDSVRARRIIDGTAEGRNILNTLKTKGYLE